MTDWLGHYTGVGSALAGLDMCMPGDGAVPLLGDSYWGSEMSRSILNGSVPVDRLNDMVCIKNRPRPTTLLVEAYADNHDR
jgi:beta-glucosidase